MAVKKKKLAQAQTNLATTLEEFLDRSRELFLDNEKDIRRILDGSEDNNLVVNFSMHIDESEGQQKLETKIRFSETFSYKSVCQIEPGQKKFTEVDEEARAATKEAKANERASRKTKTEKEKEAEDAPA
jgi:hypothetical protein